MTTITDKTQHIQAIQYLQANFAKDKMMPALRYGRNDVNCLIKTNYEIKAILRILYCYKVFNSEVGKAIQLITRPATEIGAFNIIAGGDNPINILEGSPATTVSGKIYSELKDPTSNFSRNIIEEDKGDVYLDGDKVSIWVSTGETLSIEGLPSYITQEDITENFINEILDEINCLKNSEICKLLTRAYKLIN